MPASNTDPSEGKHIPALVNIHRNLTVGFSAVVLALMIIVTVVGASLYLRLSRRNEERLQETITLILADSVNRVSFSGKYHARLLLEQIAGSQPRIMYLMIADEDQRITAHSDPSFNDELLDGDARDIARTVFETQQSHMRNTSRGDDPIREIAMPYRSGYENAVTGVIFVGISTSESSRAVGATRRAMGALIAVLLLASLGATYVLSRHFAGPVRSMALQLKGILEHAPLPIYIADRWQRVVAASASFQQMPNSAAEMVRDEQTRALEGGQSLTREVARNSGDREISLLTTSFPILSRSDGTAELACTIAVDITERREAEAERKRLEAQVLHAQKLESLGVLAGGIAHDFNNMLMSVLGNADLAENDLPPGSPARESLLEIAATATRAADLCKQLLAYSGKGRFVIESVDVSRLVEDMAKMLAVSISKKATLRFEFAQEPALVRADATQLRQIAMNLITNASEALGDSEGTITVRTGVRECRGNDGDRGHVDGRLPDGRCVFIEVSDTGCGMDAETEAKLFDPFFTTKTMGRGLGLSAVLGIVRSHEGAVEVRSEVGKGTTFRVLLPALAAEVAATPGPPPSDQALPESLNGTILLVDDEESVRLVTRRLLERMGLRVLVACDGCEAVDVYRAHADEVDCVILDLTMPHMSGEQAFSELRRVRANVKVIIASGYSEQEIGDHLSHEGLAGFIQKPFQSAALLNKLSQVL